MTPDSMIYPERINALNGEPGGGKTWVALKACAEAIAAAVHVIFIDLEDHAASTIARMRALGSTDEDLAAFFHYVKPDRPMGPEAMEYLERKVVELGVELIVIDSVGELMSLQGVKPNDDDAVAALYRAIPKRLAKLGPAVLLIDHVPKRNEDTPLFAIGSQRKKAAIDGASFMVSTVKAFAAGTDGMLKLVTAKDRLGNFVSGSAAALVNVSTADDGAQVVLDVAEPETAPDTGEMLQTANMRKLSDWLERQPARSAHRAAIDAAKVVSLKHVTTVLRQLEAAGCVSADDQGTGKPTFYRLVRPFSDAIRPALNAAPLALNAGDPDEF